MKADLLADLATAVNDSISKGLGIDYFREQFDSIVAKHGWQYKGSRNWRTRVIFGTNLRVSYAAGRLAQLRDPELRALKPFWMYRHSGADNPRLEHKAWDKLCLPADDPWFNTHYPPNGWGCGCSVTAVSARDIKRLGGRIEKPPEGTDGIDEGWDYMPGDSVSKELAEIAEVKAPTLPKALQDEIRAHLDSVIASRAAVDEVVKLGRAAITDKEFSVIVKGGKRKALISGIENETSFTPEQLKLLNRGVLIHNHPNGGSFSPADLRIAKEQSATVIAAGHDGEIYTVRVLDNELANQADVEYRRAEAALKDQPEAFRWQAHLMCRLLAKRGLMQYSFTIVEPRWLTELVKTL